MFTVICILMNVAIREESKDLDRLGQLTISDV